MTSTYTAAHCDQHVTSVHVYMCTPSGEVLTVTKMALRVWHVTPDPLSCYKFMLPSTHTTRATNCDTISLPMVQTTHYGLYTYRITQVNYVSTNITLVWRYETDEHLFTETHAHGHCKR